MASQQEILKRAQPWLQEPFDEATQREVRRLIESDPKGLSDAFFKELSFGTGGMRGIMGVGTNRINIYTIRAATQGLANYLNNQPPCEKGRSVFIGFDVRRHSKEFAQEAARTLAGNGIRVYLTKEICPTPLVSFGCRYYNCQAAIVITASHNPPQYNGYKVYWSDGGQVVAPHDVGIMEEVRRIQDARQILVASEDSPLIQEVGKELDEAYLVQLKKLPLYPDLQGSDLQILYTPLHGTGVRIMQSALETYGFRNLAFVEEQKIPDGAFSFAPSPNPEDPKALELGIQKLMKDRSDLLIATDPDADRLGVVSLDRSQPFTFTGNQTACLCLLHICSALTAKGEFPPNAAFVKTIVTTELFREIALSFGGTCIDVLTGFKYIAEQIALWEKSFDSYQYIFGAEESYGSLFGTTVRDKDAISSACLIAEVAALAKRQNLTLTDRLYQIYERYGVHRESLTSLSFSDSATGLAQMNSLMQHLRKAPPSSIANIPVTTLEDYASQEALDVQHHTTSVLQLPKSDVLRFWLADRTKVVIRPSGTEPKVKIYVEIVQKSVSDVERSIREADERLEQIVQSFQQEFVP